MVPIYDTDIAEERWSKSDWEHYELWEKVENRLHRRKRLWILGTAVVFLAVSSIPIVANRLPKWKAMQSCRILAQEINRIKRDAGVDHAAYRIRFANDGSLRYVVERLASCSSPQATVVRSGALLPEPELGNYVLMSPRVGEENGIPGLIDGICYDYLAGSDAVLRGEGLIGFGILPAKDLTERRLDRVSVLLVSGPSAEISFD